MDCQKVMLDKLTAHDFQPHVKTTFQVRLNDNESTTLYLTNVAEHSVELAAPGAGRLPFTLTFHANHRGGYLPQQIWQFNHDVLGQMELFIVPIGPDANGMRYEAVFN